MSRRGIALILGVLFAALLTAAAFIASTYEDYATAVTIKENIELLK